MAAEKKLVELSRSWRDLPHYAREIVRTGLIDKARAVESRSVRVGRAIDGASPGDPGADVHVAATLRALARVIDDLEAA